MIKRIELLDKNDIKKQLITINENMPIVSEERDIEIMKAVCEEKPFYKFSADNIKGLEEIRNDEHLFYDDEFNIWQVCVGCALDMRNNRIPNTYNVRVIGTWFSFD